MSLSREKLVNTVRCPRCHSELSNGATSSALEDLDHLDCAQCRETFPIINGIPRFLLSPFREALLGNGRAAGLDNRQVQTALSFGFEWSRFPEMYSEWKQSFLNYMQPHGPEIFARIDVLNA